MLMSYFHYSNIIVYLELYMTDDDTEQSYFFVPWMTSTVFKVIVFTLITCFMFFI